MVCLHQQAVFKITYYNKSKQLLEILTKLLIRITSKPIGRSATSEELCTESFKFGVVLS